MAKKPSTSGGHTYRRAHPAGGSKRPSKQMGMEQMMMQGAPQASPGMQPPMKAEGMKKYGTGGVANPNGQTKHAKFINQ